MRMKYVGANRLKLATDPIITTTSRQLTQNAAIGTYNVTEYSASNIYVNVPGIFTEISENVLVFREYSRHGK